MPQQFFRYYCLVAQANRKKNQLVVAFASTFSNTEFKKSMKIANHFVFKIIHFVCCSRFQVTPNSVHGTRENLLAYSQSRRVQQPRELRRRARQTANFADPARLPAGLYRRSSFHPRGFETPPPQRRRCHSSVSFCQQGWFTENHRQIAGWRGSRFFECVFTTEIQSWRSRRLWEYAKRFSRVP